MSLKQIAKRLINSLSLFPLTAFSTMPCDCTLYPVGQKLYDLYPYSFVYYYGITASDALARMVFFDFHRWPESIQSVEFDYTIAETNPIRQFFSPIVGVMQLAANMTIRSGKNEPLIYEFNPQVIWRWANFPWNHYLVTSFALGEGISYATSVPSLEKKHNRDTKRLLNFMLIETTFAPPLNPRLQLIARVHHRSGAYGLYHAGNTGSNVVAVGIRYMFD